VAAVFTTVQQWLMYSQQYDSGCCTHNSTTVAAVFTTVRQWLLFSQQYDSGCCIHNSTTVAAVLTTVKQWLLYSQQYDGGCCIHTQFEPKATSAQEARRGNPTKKATQSTQVLKSNIIRLSWLTYYLISLTYMEVPEHSIPQTCFRIQQK
jgi:hypothetical protein